MKDQRGPMIRALAEQPGQRLYWRYEHTEDDESRGTWLFECVRDEGEWWCVRQISPNHPHVRAAAYDWQHLEDDSGFLTDQPLPDDAPGEAITGEDFERAWAQASCAPGTSQ